MERRFFFFDIDNTLAVWPDGVIPDSAQEALRLLRKNGHRVALERGVCSVMRSGSRIWLMCMILLPMVAAV